VFGKLFTVTGKTENLKQELTMHVDSAKELDVYKIAYEQAMQIYELSRNFPKEEMYSLTSQATRSSRSVCANLREAWAKRRLVAHFKSKLTDCDGENSEAETWIDFAKDCNYINDETHDRMVDRNHQIGRMLGSMICKAETFCQPDKI